MADDRKTAFLPKVYLGSALFALTGILAGIVRYFHLQTGFEPAELTEIAGLAKPGNVFAILLSVASVLVCGLLLLLFLVDRRKKSRCGLVVGRIGGQTHIALILAVLAACAGAGLQIGHSITQFSVWGLISGGLLLAAGASVMQTARFLGRRSRGETVGPPAVLFAVFWACAYLVELYQEVSRSPALLRYIFPLLGVIAALFVFYTTAGFIFARMRLSGVVYAVWGMLFFVPLNVLGEGLYLWKNGLLFAKEAAFFAWRPACFALFALAFGLVVLSLLRNKLPAE